MLKYDRKDAQDILDRASARETAARVAVGAVCRKLLEPFGIRIFSFVREIGSVRAKNIPKDPAEIDRPGRSLPGSLPGSGSRKGDDRTHR